MSITSGEQNYMNDEYLKTFFLFHILEEKEFLGVYPSIF